MWSKKFSFEACRIAPPAARSFARCGEALSNLMAAALLPETMTSTNALKGSVRVWQVGNF
jgi:hypothetical protein